MNHKELHLFNNLSYIDLYPIQFGKEACAPLHSFGPSLKEHYLFHYIVSGRGTFYNTEEETAHKLEAGQGFLIPPHLVCSYEADKADPWTYIWIEFDGLKSDYFLKQAGLDHKHLIFSQKKNSFDSPVYTEAINILASHNQRSAKVIAHLYLFIDALISQSINHKVIPHNETKDFYIREAINFIERNFQFPITVEEIAKSCNLNRHYFCRLFREQTNSSPQQFLIQYRLSKACALLKNRNLNLSDIAEQIGYSNQFNFSAAFKRQYGISPRQWRKTL